MIRIPEQRTESVTLCCWCDKPATRNLDSYYDVACDHHHATYFTPATACGCGVPGCSGVTA